MKISQTQFEKHVYGKEKKRQTELLEEFDPRPPEFKGTAAANLTTFLDKIKGRNLGVSLFLDPSTKAWMETSGADEVESPFIPSDEQLLHHVAAFKQSLKLPASKIREIERETRDQAQSPLWFSVRKYRITASFFGEIFSRLPQTPPHHLVLRIIDPKPFSSAATEWGKVHESVALEQYIKYHKDRGNVSLVASNAGFVISEDEPYLGASPDGYVYDPSSLECFGLVEIKCPYKFREHTIGEACHNKQFYCELVPQSGGGHPLIQLKKSHSYYCQIQGQMAITGRAWCDFVVYTTKDFLVERVAFDKSFWLEKLLPKLKDFYDKCVAPEIVPLFTC